MKLLDEDALAVTGEPVRPQLNGWEKSERPSAFRELLRARRSVAMDPAAAAHGLPSTVAFPPGNLGAGCWRTQRLRE
jgi:dihydroxyacid dehydratase/phosphogluconate dehydratase